MGSAPQQLALHRARIPNSRRAALRRSKPHGALRTPPRHAFSRLRGIPRRHADQRAHDWEVAVPLRAPSAGLESPPRAAWHPLPALSLRTVPVHGGVGSELTDASQPPAGLLLAMGATVTSSVASKTQGATPVGDTRNFPAAKEFCDR